MIPPDYCLRRRIPKASLGRRVCGGIFPRKTALLEDSTPNRRLAHSLLNTGFVDDSLRTMPAGPPTGLVNQNDALSLKFIANAIALSKILSFPGFLPLLNQRLNFWIA